MDELRTLTTDQLHARNLSLINQRDTIKEAQRAITRELDRRDEIGRQARVLAELPDEMRAAALAGADPELSERVTALVVESAVPRPADQTIEPEGIESAEAVGEPGRKRGWRR